MTLSKEFVVQVKNPSTGRWKKIEDTESHTFGLARSRAIKLRNFSNAEVRVYNSLTKQHWPLTDC